MNRLNCSFVSFVLAYGLLVIPESFRKPLYHACPCEKAIRFPRSPLAPPLGELAAKPTERVKTPSPPLRGTSPIGRGKASSALWATYTLLCNCHWQLLDFNSLRGAPPSQGKALVGSISRKGTKKRAADGRPYSF